MMSSYFISCILHCFIHYAVKPLWLIQFPGFLFCASFLSSLLKCGLFVSAWSFVLRRHYRVSLRLPPIPTRHCFAFADRFLQEAARSIFERNTNSNSQSHAKLQPQQWRVLPSLGMLTALSSSLRRARRPLLALAGNKATASKGSNGRRGGWRRRLIQLAVVEPIVRCNAGIRVSKKVLLRRVGLRAASLPRDQPSLGHWTK